MALPDDVAFEGNRDLDARYGMALQGQALETVQTAFGDRATIASPVQPFLADREAPSVLAGSPVIYVHSKVLIADNSFAMIGSANMNGRSMRWDTEVALRITDKQRVAKTWQAMCAHWWHREQMLKQRPALSGQQQTGGTVRFSATAFACHRPAADFWCRMIRRRWRICSNRCRGRPKMWCDGRH
ncbi:phospholipase D-like domain-containing protein [Phaeobacter sp. BS23]|uniref:phospholipase D-like domain-containing protein n=1 Tax=Phaeobacter sp. BS23 TaxID=2907239 RepID=UPI0038698906